MVKEYLGITVDAANRHDMKMTKTALQSIVVHRPEPTESKVQQHMCMDKVYGYPEVYELKIMVIQFISVQDENTE
jgi:hypothetical protein